MTIGKEVNISLNFFLSPYNVNSDTLVHQRKGKLWAGEIILLAISFPKSGEASNYILCFFLFYVYVYDQLTWTPLNTVNDIVLTPRGHFCIISSEILLCSYVVLLFSKPKQLEA